MSAVAWSHRCKISAFVDFMKDFKKQHDSIKNYFILKHSRRTKSLSESEESIGGQDGYGESHGNTVLYEVVLLEVLLEVVVLGRT